MIADIASGHADAADVLFLLAAILAGLAAVVAVLSPEAPRVSLGWLAVACLSVAWLLL